ncbi:ribosome recycling factor [Aedoeadaptatus acetigenes]|mgnify:CR=1 FL=1|uniref:Ribosome-recycling factor n=1 Tax=Aedoeadaptatus acetigenes TaxID=2981723 RepID=A0ABV1J5R6_9FIRM|nr:ribosome recycling factor [Aedoeadaptatus acetigenes]MBS6524952.1 ribosome recycling factor [Peptoniphilaceae bacterium]MCU6787022.1 ribosome recycling factor [Aedoeadaptatus acetigenes]
MDFSEVKKEVQTKTEKTADRLKEELASIRAGRANPSLLDRITVEAYGQQTPLNQVAGITAPEARLLTIQPWDASLIPAIEKEILKSDLGLNPSNDGKLIRLAIPALTEERRKEMIKVVGKDAEQSKVAIRNVRRDAIDLIKKAEKNKEISEDDQKDYEEEIQKIIDAAVKNIDAIAKAKEDELLEI